MIVSYSGALRGCGCAQLFDGARSSYQAALGRQPSASHAHVRMSAHMRKNVTLLISTGTGKIDRGNRHKMRARSLRMRYKRRTHEQRTGSPVAEEMVIGTRFPSVYSSFSPLNARSRMTW